MDKELAELVSALVTFPAREAFYDRARIGAPDECWPWAGKQAGGQKGNRYGYLVVSGRSVPAHRISYELHRGSIPAGLEIDHLCRNRLCVNPAHLEAVTHQENIFRSPLCVATVNAKKTICAHGHELTAENVATRPGQKRRCRTCEREAARVYYHQGGKAKQQAYKRERRLQSGTR